ncbi:hypothetical protein [Vibrio vulnificus]|uniref:hypothetical protein n=1 Tax=Vibrio vulnificus TaxID=672 RepID=UPI0010335273|nr:hypothetical protein [Vibrio vulnificus]EIT7146592.1 hypothetical protein [Vibrio vulnificus]MCU8478838.1 hypothetical protein [Vibrio vulnificus]QBH27084.1 hypothetical protein FORC77_1361 [Vibrio vulnificus]
MSKFIVAAERLDEKKFIAFLEQSGFGWWHWIDNFWLITVKNGAQISTQTLQNKVTELSHSPRNFVLEIEGHPPWHAFGPNSTNGGQNMFEWLHDVFDKD